MQVGGWAWLTHFPHEFDTLVTKETNGNTKRHHNCGWLHSPSCTANNDCLTIIIFWGKVLAAK